MEPKKQLGNCKEKRCRKPAAKKKGGRCHNCAAKAYKASHPIEYAYQKWKCSVRRRGHKFEISPEYFREFCYRTQILHGRGRTSEAWHIDKIIDELGYVEGNIQKLTCKENVTKENKRRALKRKVITYDWQTKTGTTITLPESTEIENAF